jgi:MMP alpha-(1->4)-mannosyltransferase
LVGAYSAASAFVHACEIETFGLSVLEAMACGRAVVAVDGGAVPEVLGDAGVLAPVGDSLSFSVAVRQILADSQHRHSLGLRARARAQEFSLFEMQRAYWEALERIADGSAVSPDP